MATKTPRFARRNLPLLLLQARESVMGKFRPVLNSHGITEQQWRVVRALLEQGPLEPRQIGELCTILSPSLTGVLARMDDLGLVTRTRLDHDQRRVRVALTPKSRGLAVRIAPQIESVYERLEARLGADFAAQLYAALDRTIDLLQEPLDADGEAEEA